MSNKTCFQCDEEIVVTEESGEIGYQIYDPSIRQILEMGGDYILYFHPKCLDKFKKENEVLFNTSQR